LEFSRQPKATEVEHHIKSLQRASQNKPKQAQSIHSSLSSQQQQQQIRSFTMPTTTRRSISGGGPLLPADDNVVAAVATKKTTKKKDAPPMTPGKKVAKLEAELEEKNAQNKMLQSQIDELTSALDGITLVKQKIDKVINVEIVHNAVHKKDDVVVVTTEDDSTMKTEDAGEVEGEEGTAVKAKKPRAKKDKDAPVPAKTAYKFYCDANPPKNKNGKDEEKDMRLAWKEAAPEIRQVFINLAEADKARFQRENVVYTTEKEALQKYYEKQTQDVAMELLDATLVAQAALDKVNAEKKNKKKHKKDPEAPKHPLSAYLYYTMDQREAVVAANPGIKPTEITTTLAEMWKSGAVKNVKKYEDLAAIDKARFEEEKAVYDAVMAQRQTQADQEKVQQLQHDKEEAMKLMKERVQDAATVVSGSVAGTGGGAASASRHVVDDMSVLTDDNTKNTKQPRKKKDPNAPKKNMSAYLYFSVEQRETIKAKMAADATNVDVLTEIGRQWKELAPKKKEKYDKMAVKDKARYVKEMESYTKTMTNAKAAN
jgi:HMG (high mobility group) box